jgi:hypothetical protein
MEKEAHAGSGGRDTFLKPKQASPPGAMLSGKELGEAEPTVP